MSREDLEVTALLEVLSEHKVVFLYFWAPWCAPCQQFSTIYEQVAAQFSDICFTKVNIEKQKSLADYFAIQSIPYILVFNQSSVVYAQAGSLALNDLAKLAQQAEMFDLEVVRHVDHSPSGLP